MFHRLKTQAGRARDALHKQADEPVFGNIDAVTGFRRFFLRRLKRVSGEWTLVFMARNFKRLAVLAHSRVDKGDPRKSRRIRQNRLFPTG
ncbi:transposase [Accumulibacter sp.]|uniref:transposase n=1 Tax=Accumulibacter sp. TaxID=2053492 RepID=UPI0035B39A98